MAYVISIKEENGDEVFLKRVAFVRAHEFAGERGGTISYQWDKPALVTADPPKRRPGRPRKVPPK